MNWDGLDVGILGPAAVAGLIVLATHVPLGIRVLARGIIFIDLAIAQIAALGVVIAQYFGMDEQGLGIQIAAAAAALLGAALLNATDKRWPEFQEPLIGTLFVLAASGGILVLANNPHGGEHLKDLLVGQIRAGEHEHSRTVLHERLRGAEAAAKGDLASAMTIGSRPSPFGSPKVELLQVTRTVRGARPASTSETRTSKRA